MIHIILDDEVANTVLDLLTEFNLQEANITEQVDNGADGTGLNAEDDTVLAELTKYNDAIEPDGIFPGDVVLGNLDSVAHMILTLVMPRVLLTVRRRVTSLSFV